jgi:Tfp pilus assembly protein PilV
MTCTRTRTALRDERGSFLIEVLVSALLLIMLTGGAIAAFDSAAKQSGQQRSQAVAANLAASEMERLRSIKFSDLDGLDVTHPPKDVDGTPFTIRSQTAEAFDPQAAGSGCDTSSRSPQALRATTTVTWPDMRGRAPVAVSSIIAAPASANSSRGNLSVQVLDKDGLGVNALTIQLVGPSNVSGVTDDNGCVRFTDLLPDNGYHLKFSRAGWKKTPGGQQDVDDVVSVVAGQSTTLGYQYDPSTPITATFRWRKYTGSNLGWKDAPVTGVTWTHATLPGGAEQQTVSPPNHVVTSPVFASSATPYGVYAGACAPAAPVPPRPGDSALAGNAVTVDVPTLRVRVVYGGNGVAGARVFVTTACGDRIDAGLTDSSGYVWGGFPFGTLTKVCAQQSPYYVQQLNVPNTTYGAENQVTLTAPASPPTGTCS